MMKSQHSISLCVSVFSVVNICLSLASGAELQLRRSCPCGGSLVSLADVAEIYARDTAEAERLARIELFPAPTPGSSRLVRASEIRDVLGQRGVDLRQVRFVGASSIWIQGGAEENAVATATYAAPIAAAQQPSSFASQVVVPLRPLRRGEVIRAGDVQLQSQEGQADAAAVTYVEEVIGREVVRPVAAGRAIARADLQAPVLVQKNELVTVYVRTRGVQVRTSAKALAAGVLGEIIPLASLLARDAQFMARVIGEKEVEVLTGAAPAVSPTPPVAAAPAPAKNTSGQRGMFGLRVHVADDADSSP